MSWKYLLRVIPLLGLFHYTHQEQNCYNPERGDTYNGTVSVTHTGRHCQRWESQYPHRHVNYRTPAEFRDNIVLENYCRVARGEAGAPWCYTTDEGTRWDYCDIPECTPGCPAGKFGESCDQDCHCRDSTETCDVSTGTCLSGCADGWSGFGCQRAQYRRPRCPTGQFGRYCEKTCHCRDSLEDCDVTTGTCLSGCADGWTGVGCQQEHFRKVSKPKLGRARCPTGTFGRRCDQACHCWNSLEDCDVTTGTCMSGCAEGWSGFGCQIQRQRRTPECPSDWTSVQLASGLRCYKFFTIPVSHREAKRKCWGLDGHSNLAMPKTAEMHRELNKLSPRLRKGRNVWIGLDDWQHEGVFVWADGTYLGDVTFWGKDSPNNKAKREHCVDMAPGGEWDDRTCGTKRAYFCELDPMQDDECTDTAGVVDMDGRRKSCDVYIEQYGNFMCGESLVRRLCCMTCRREDRREEEVKYPEKLEMELYIAADKEALRRFKNSLEYPHSDTAAKFLMKQSIMDDNYPWYKLYFDQDLNITMKISRIDILDENLQRAHEDGNYVKSQAMLSLFPDWFNKNGVYESLRFDLAMILTGFSFRDGKMAADPGRAKARGRANSPGACDKSKASVVLYDSGPPLWNYGSAHEIGHMLKLGHGSGGIMYGKSNKGHAFIDTQLERVHNYLNPIWDGTIARDARSPAVFPVGNIQKSYIGTNCLRDTTPDPVNPNKYLRADEKTPDVLCRNSYGNSSYFCHYPPYYNMKVPTGDAMCNNLHCVIGGHTECYRLDNVQEYTRGMECAVGGKTCQHGRCLPSRRRSNKACPPGQFGQFCDTRCRCHDTRETCHSDTGVCRSGCADGWTGDNCQTPVCPKGWTGLASSGKCYKYVKNPATYDEANTNCKKLGGDKSSLALVKSADIESLLIRLSKGPFWIGLDDRAERSTWRWLDGSFPVWSNWYRHEKSRNTIWFKQPIKDQPRNWRGGTECAAVKDGVWYGTRCDNSHRYFCEVDNLHIHREPNNFCPNGDQLYVTRHHLGNDLDTKDLLTCHDVITTYGAAACLGDFPVRAMKHACCESCRRALDRLIPDISRDCPYLEEGYFPQPDQSRRSCAEHMRKSPRGRHACADEHFRTFCCQSCTVQAVTPRGFVAYSTPAKKPSKDCPYGSVLYLDAPGELSHRTCDDVISERGPGVCGVTSGYNISQPFDELCCDQCHANPSDGCVYDDGNVEYRGNYMSCSAYTSRLGYTACGEKTFRETCCKTCARQMARKQEYCGAEWEYAFAIDACFQKTPKARKSFADATKICEGMGGHLPTPKNQREAKYFWERKKSQWLGLTSVSARRGNTQWKWIDGEPLSWSDWIVESTEAPKKNYCVYSTSAGWGRTSCDGSDRSGKKGIPPTYSFSCVKDI